MELAEYKREFIEFMVRSHALKFGDFTLKSGRKSPYFMNVSLSTQEDKEKTAAAKRAAHTAPVTVNLFFITFSSFLFFY